jgi:hypothetical protein
VLTTCHWAQFRAQSRRIRARPASLEPLNGAHFHALDTDCAQSFVTISVTRSMEGIVDSRVNVQATVFVSSALGEFVFRRRFHEIRKCLRIVYLQDAR